VGAEVLVMSQYAVYVNNGVFMNHGELKGIRAFKPTDYLTRSTDVHRHCPILDGFAFRSMAYLCRICRSPTSATQLSFSSKKRKRKKEKKREKKRKKEKLQDTRSDSHHQVCPGSPFAMT
jgi:hypothetical protein